MPMFFPLALAGFLVAPPLAMITGVAAPLLSALLTGMPPFYPPIAFIMMAEGLLFTGLPQALQNLLRLPAWAALFIILLLDRVLLFSDGPGHGRGSCSCRRPCWAGRRFCTGSRDWP